MFLQRPFLDPSNILKDLSLKIHSKCQTIWHLFTLICQTFVGYFIQWTIWQSAGISQDSQINLETSSHSQDNPSRRLSRKVAALVSLSSFKAIRCSLEYSCSPNEKKVSHFVAFGHKVQLTTCNTLFNKMYLQSTYLHISNLNILKREMY